MTCVLPTSSKVPELKLLARMSCERYIPNHYDNHQIKLYHVLYNIKNVRSNSPKMNSPNMNSPNMKYEANRLQSFTSKKKWPLSFVRPEECAAVGLYYIGDGDRVQCAFCKGIIGSWDAGDKPLVEHVKHFPMCPFLLQQDVGNVPINGVNGHQKWQTSNAHPEQTLSTGSVSNAMPRTIPNFLSKYPSMASFDKRLETYNSCENSVIATITPSRLVEAGLFYSDVADVVTCFCCGGSMGNWNAGEDAWTEHAKHFPTCSYVKSIKGSSFIEQARMKHVSENAATNGVQECATPESLQITHMEENSAPYVENFENICHEMEEMEIGEGEYSATGTSNHENGLFMCKICTELRTRAAFIPCGHSCTCPDCAKKLSVCPLCREPIQSFVRLYFD